MRLLGCVCKKCKNCGNCCCSTRLVATTKKPLEREKGTMLFVTLHHWINPVKTIEHLPGPADRIISKRGDHHLRVLGTWTSCCWISVTLRIPKMREANNIIHKLMCEEQHMRNKRVWSIKHSNTDFGLPKVCLYGICKYSPLFQRGLWSLTSPYPCLCRLEISTLCCAFAFWNWGSGLVSS